MRVLYQLHGLPPHHNAGAELYALELLRWLRARGHAAEVLIPPTRWPLGAAGPDGIRIHKRGPVRWDQRHYTNADVALTHLDETPIAVRLASSTGTPLVHIVHNDRQLQFHKVSSAALAVANSSWTAAAIPAGIPTITVFPPCPPHRYQIPDGGLGDSVVFVNPSVAKGAPLVYELARRLPEVPFLIVGGGYGAQVDPPAGLPNVELWRNQADPRTFYAEARLVLMPSVYESFGRVPVEAAASGIPTIARPTPGLVEALEDAGTYAGTAIDPDVFHRGDELELTELLLAEADEWQARLLELYNGRRRYTAASKAATARARQLEVLTAGQLELLEAALLELTN